VDPGRRKPQFANLIDVLPVGKSEIGRRHRQLADIGLINAGAGAACWVWPRRRRHTREQPQPTTTPNSIGEARRGGVERYHPKHAVAPSPAKDVAPVTSYGRTFIPRHGD
jgi:hypothetical protein